MLIAWHDLYMSESMPHGSKLQVTEKNFLSLTIEQYHALSADELARAAKFAGMEPAAFLKLVTKGKEKGEAYDAQREIERAETERMRAVYIRIPAHKRPELIQMNCSDEQLKAAQDTEKRAYDLLNTPDTDEVKRLFRESQSVIMRKRFATLCMNSTLSLAIHALEREKKEIISKTNVPDLRDAIESNLAALQKWVNSVRKSEASIRGKWAASGGIAGPEERYGDPRNVRSQKTNKPRSPK